MTEKEKKLKVLKHKFKYDGYHLYAIENIVISGKSLDRLSNPTEKNFLLIFLIKNANHDSFIS